jgi:hypothetical protein
MTEDNFDASPQPQDTLGVTLALGISPTGRVHLDAVASESDQLAPSTVMRIRKAFEHSNNRGLLHLGASELASTLPPSLAFGRELAHLFMARLCAVPDLAQQWQAAQIAPPR